MKARWWILIFALLLVLALVASALEGAIGASGAEVPTPSDTIAPTATGGTPATPTSTATRAATSTPTVGATSTLTPTATAVPTDTPTGVPTDTPTPVPTETPTAVLGGTATPTDEPTATPTATGGSGGTETPTPFIPGLETHTPTPPPTATATETPVPTPTLSPTPTAVPTETPTLTPAPTATATQTVVPTDTPTATATEAPTSTPTTMPTATAVVFSLPEGDTTTSLQIGNIGLQVPPGAVDSNGGGTVTIQEITPPPGATIGMEFHATDSQGSVVTELGAPITITVNCAPTCAAGDVIARWDPSASGGAGDWILLPTEVDMVAQTLSATTDHFSIFGRLSRRLTILYLPLLGGSGKK